MRTRRVHGRACSLLTRCWQHRWTFHATSLQRLLVASHTRCTNQADQQHDRELSAPIGRGHDDRLADDGLAPQLQVDARRVRRCAPVAVRGSASETIRMNAMRVHAAESASRASETSELASRGFRPTLRDPGEVCDWLRRATVIERRDHARHRESDRSSLSAYADDVRNAGATKRVPRPAN